MSRDLPAFRHDSFTGWIGVAREDVTPPAGIYARNWGAAAGDTADGIHRPLTLTALVLQESQGGSPLVLVDVDAGWWRNGAVARRFRKRLLQALELESRQLLFALTHTHAAVPLTDEPDPDWEGGALLRPYLELVFERTLEAVSRARVGLAPATLEWHLGRCALATVRDLPDPAPGSGRRVCGFTPGAAADETLLVGRVSDQEGNVVATLCHYACHPTTLAWENRKISPDFVGAMREVVEAHCDGAPALFLQGASGDLSPRYQYVGDTSVADRHGRQLGHAVLATLEDMEAPRRELAFCGVEESGAPLALWRPRATQSHSELRAVELEVELPIKPWPSAAELDRKVQETPERVEAERLRRQRDIRRALGDADTFSLPFWVWELGSAVLIAHPGEAYSCFAAEARRTFAPRTVACMNLVNGSIGYLPPAELYDEDVYQVWQTPFDRGSLERLAQAVVSNGASA